MDKEKALDIALAQIEKQFGKGTIVRLGEKSIEPIEVIPTCTDVDRFVPGPRDPALESSLGLSGHLVLGCVGTMSNWYLREPMLDYLAFLLKDSDSKPVIGDITPSYATLSRNEFARMSQLSQNSRFLYLMRDPIDRLWSEIRMSGLKTAKRVTTGKGKGQVETSD